jgi:predicted tellurium resistance membrane protein TerC
MEWITDPQAWIALATLTALEIVLGIDNIIFISIVAGKLPRHLHNRARRTGLLAAMFMRVALLLSIVWVIGLTQPWFTIAGQEISGRDVILISGGLFLLGKSTWEIHENLEGAKAGDKKAEAKATFFGVLLQIMLLDIVFSLDSIITAVGMARQISVMIAAVILAVGVMMFAAKPIALFVDQHPTIKILALSFLLLIGFSLVAEGFDSHIPKGYIYFAMGFSVMVEMINLRMRAAAPVRLQRTYTD